MSIQKLKPKSRPALKTKTFEVPILAIAKPGEIFVSTTFIRKLREFEPKIGREKAEAIFWALVYNGEIEPTKTLAGSNVMAFQFADDCPAEISIQINNRGEYGV